MKNNLVFLGLTSAGVSTFLAVLGTVTFNERSFEHTTHLITVAAFIGLFSIMSFVAAKLYNQ